MANKTYVELVNSTIQESGADLASYSVNGADFTTNTDSLMRRFKVWVQRAWHTLQQDADDWQFLTSRGVVNVGPRAMFYAYGDIPGVIPPVLDIYDADDNIKIPDLSISGMTDLTGKYSSEDPNKSYGYVTVDEASYPVTFTLKPGNDYFYLNGRLIEYTKGTNLNLFYTSGINIGAVLSVAVIQLSDSENPFVANNCLTITDMDPFSQDAYRGTTSFKFTTNNKDLIAYIDSGDYQIGLFLNPTDQYTAQEYLTNTDPKNQVLVTLDSDSPLTDELVDTKAYIHSWGSYDWNEEMAENDFTDHVKEVNSSTYKIIRTSTADATLGEDLICAPWQQFLERVEGAQYMAADPVFIAEDSQGRWRLWPAPKERVTITFDYARTPQVMQDYNDVPQHLDSEYEDLIVWKALISYGEFSEQPGVVRRAIKEYMNIKYRFEKNKRPVFNFQPAGFGRRW